MTTFNLTCEAVEATLPDYLDETLEGWLRESIDEHLTQCARCTALVRDLRQNARESASLPALLPDQDVWSAIAGRIGAPVTGSDPVQKKARVTGSDPVEEKAPVTPVIERIIPIVPTGDAPLPIEDLPAGSSKPAVPIRYPPVLADEPPVLTSEPPVLTSEPPALTSEPTFPPSDLWLPTSAPLAPVREPLVPSSAPVPATAPVYSFAGRREKRWQGPVKMGLAAAALVLVTATTSSLLTVHWLGPTRTRNVASDMGSRKPSSSERPPAEQRTREQPAERGNIASESSSLTPLPGQLGSTLTVAATMSPTVTSSPEEVVYDKEINTLTRIVRRRKSELNPSTVTVIEKNLRALDSAIAQIRAALQEDPRSSLLDGQASRALEMKVELLRRAAMLRSST